MATGRLRVYLSAAPGVGKTYAMLSEGQRRRSRGTDVAVALPEVTGAEQHETLPDEIAGRADQRSCAEEPAAAVAFATAAMVLLAAGDKAGKGDRWYAEAIPHAEQLYEIQ